MAESNVEHIVKEGERWDLLAQRYYGDPLAYERIVAANPEIAIRPQLQSGMKLRIPVIEGGQSQTRRLPPWLQS